MMAADSLHVAVHLIVPSGVSIQWLSGCCRACSASASALPSHVQASCLERAWPAAIAAFAGALAAPAAAPPGRWCLERQRKAKAEGKIKGRGTSLRETAVCTWGGRGTRLIAAPCRVDRQCLAGIGESACLARLTSTVLDGGAA